jgi:hypothetical protein
MASVSPNACNALTQRHQPLVSGLHSRRHRRSAQYSSSCYYHWVTAAAGDVLPHASSEGFMQAVDWAMAQLP